MPPHAECFRRKYEARSVVENTQCVAILENIPHEEVFRECTIFGIFFDSWIAEQYKQIDMRSCLSVASSSIDYQNRTFGLRAQDVFAPFFCFFSFR